MLCQYAKKKDTVNHEIKASMKLMKKMWVSLTCINKGMHFCLDILVYTVMSGSLHMAGSSNILNKALALHQVPLQVWSVSLH